MNASIHKVFLAIPLMDERDSFPDLMQDLENQSYKDFTAVMCINQPDNWWKIPEKKVICERNMETLSRINSLCSDRIKVIDRCSPGKGWQGRRKGVGWARKTLMDECTKGASPADVLISLDADTRISKDYVASVVDNLRSHPDIAAISIPYYHRLTGEPIADRCILRYEIYMRYYSLNLWRIHSPYSFTALGSAIALPVKSYKAIRGLTPHQSGEDFYFLQKLRKYGPLLYWNREKVYPSARYSDRVFFGTGPAMIKGRGGDWSSYPFYEMAHFNEVLSTFKSFAAQYKASVPTPMDAFLSDIFSEKDIWEPLRKNHPVKERFIRACHEKVDALRVLQFLKSRNQFGNEKDEENLLEFLNACFPSASVLKEMSLPGFSFSTASIDLMDRLRDFLQEEEEKIQYSHYQKMLIK